MKKDENYIKSKIVYLIYNTDRTDVLLTNAKEIVQALPTVTPPENEFIDPAAAQRFIGEMTGIYFTLEELFAVGSMVINYVNIKEVEIHAIFAIYSDKINNYSYSNKFRKYPIDDLKDNTLLMREGLLRIYAFHHPKFKIDLTLTIKDEITNNPINFKDDKKAIEEAVQATDAKDY